MEKLTAKVKALYEERDGVLDALENGLLNGDTNKDTLAKAKEYKDITKEIRELEELQEKLSSL